MSAFDKNACKAKWKTCNDVLKTVPAMDMITKLQIAMFHNNKKGNYRRLQPPLVRVYQRQDQWWWYVDWYQ